jgi:hypothetical protein
VPPTIMAERPLMLEPNGDGRSSIFILPTPRIGASCAEHAIITAPVA